MTFKGPLVGIRVLELGHDMSSSYGARLLADLGAEVIKIEPPELGDPYRREPPLALGSYDESALFAYLNYGKRSVSLGVESVAGTKLLQQLLERIDVVICATNVSDGKSLNLDLASLDPVKRPVIVWVSPHGHLGERSAQPSSPFVVQHAAGFAFHQASPVAEPLSTPPTPCADREGSLAIGIVVANAALWALSAIENGLPKPWVDLSAEDVYAYLLVEPFADWSAGAAVHDRKRIAGKPTMVAGGLVWLLPCADGSIMISPREDHQWERWLDVMGHPKWSKDPAFCGNREIRVENAPAVGKMMSEWSIHQKCQEVFAKAQEQRVACFPVSTAKDMLVSEQLAHRQFYSKLRLASGKTVPIAGLPFLMRTSTGKTLVRGNEVAAPALGEANLEMIGTQLHLVGHAVDQIKPIGEQTAP